MKKELNYDALLNQISNKYILTIVSGERAREIARERAQNNGEMRALTKYEKKDTDVRKVFREILDGRIAYEEK